MSSLVHWEPLVTETSDEAWGVPLKTLLQNRFSYGSPIRGATMRLESDGEWLQGLIDGGSEQLRKQAQELMVILVKHQAIVLDEVN